MTKTRLAVMVFVLAAVAAITLLGTTVGRVSAAPQEEGPALEEFVPSEELPADSAVAFPVDI